MRRIIVFIALATINASTIPAVAADTAANRDLVRTRSATVHDQPTDAAENEKSCRAYAASFYQSVTLRQTAARYAGGGRTLALLDSVVNAFNDLLATKCSG